MFVPAPAASVARDLAVANPPAAGANPHRETETVGQLLNRQQTFEKIVLEVARIIFGENDLTEIKLRLVRIALERYTVQEILTGPGGV